MGDVRASQPANADKVMVGTQMCVCVFQLLLNTSSYGSNTHSHADSYVRRDTQSGCWTLTESHIHTALKHTSSVENHMQASTLGVAFLKCASVLIPLWFTDLLCDLSWIVSSFIIWSKCNTAGSKGCEQSSCLFNGCLTCEQSKLQTTYDLVDYLHLCGVICSKFNIWVMIIFITDRFFVISLISYLGKDWAKYGWYKLFFCFKKNQNTLTNNWFSWLICWLTNHFSSNPNPMLMSLYNLRTLSKSINQK